MGKVSGSASLLLSDRHNESHQSEAGKVYEGFGFRPLRFSKANPG
jgi:hypothetical protein